MPRTRKVISKMGSLAEAMAYGGEVPPLDVIYQGAFCERLIKTYKLACTTEDLENALISAADAYVEAGPLGYVPFRTGPNIEELLEGVTNSCRELSHYLWPAETGDVLGLLSRAEKAGIRAGETRGLNGKWHPIQDDRGLKLHVLRLLEALKVTAESNLKCVVEKRRPAKRGRPKQSCVEVFVRDMAIFWSRTKKRPFTVDYSSGAGGKNAVRFIIDAFQKLDTVPESVIITAARKVRKDLADKKSPTRG